MPSNRQVKILIATDAWHPQVNGVVRTLDNVIGHLRRLGHRVEVISSEGKSTFGLPSYPEIKLAFYSQSEIAGLLDKFEPDAIHIATEGPIGMAVRRACMRRKMAFTTGFHTRFAEYLAARMPLPGIERGAYTMLRRFHRPSRAVLTPTANVTRSLSARGIKNAVTWTRGVDHETFRDYGEQNTGLPTPVMVHMGRLAIEKGVEDFLKLDLPGTKLVIGDGPMREKLEQRYPEAVFTGYLFGEDLARTMNGGDVFVFPSRTDTFGLVMLEAMACGLPVAAYPVTGPIDVVAHGKSGWLDEDLSVAVKQALRLKRSDAIAHAKHFTWQNTANQFLANLVWADTASPLNELPSLAARI